MPNTAPATPQPLKRRRWVRRLALVGAGLLVLLVVVYFVATSAAFLKAVILPRVSKALIAEVTVGDASISPFSQVVLRQLTVKTTGAEPLLQANEVRLRYSLWSIIGGNIKVDEVTLDSPAIQIVQNADGTSNLDPLLKKETKPAAPPAGPSKPLQLDVRNVSMNNASVRLVADREAIPTGRIQSDVQLTNVKVNLNSLKNGGSGKLELSANMKLDEKGPTARDAGQLAVTGSGTIDFMLGPDLMPQTIKGKVTHEIVKGGGSFSELAEIGRASWRGR